MPYLLRTLGATTVESEPGAPSAIPPGKPLAVLVFLCIERRAVRRDELAQLLWPPGAGRPNRP